MGTDERHRPLRGRGMAPRPAGGPDRAGALPMMATIPEGVKVFSVTELTSAIEGTLREAFPSVWVSGEVSNVSRPSSGHIYFSLRDAETTLGSVMYRGVALRMKFDLKDGMQVLVRGR